jgi:hypothetical protein
VLAAEASNEGTCDRRNSSGGMVRLRLGRSRNSSDNVSYEDTSWPVLLIACTSGLVGVLMTKLEERLLPKDGALGRLIVAMVILRRALGSDTARLTGDRCVRVGHGGIVADCVAVVSLNKGSLFALGIVFDTNLSLYSKSPAWSAKRGC